MKIVGSTNRLEAARTAGTSQMIFTSTGSAIYGEQRQFPTIEKNVTLPLDRYGISKANGRTTDQPNASLLILSNYRTAEHVLNIGTGIETSANALAAL